MTAVTDSYIREQLEKRRERLNVAIASAPVAAPAARFRDLLAEVDAAIERMDAGTYGICEVCSDTVERDRLIEDPLVRFCLDHLSGEERRAASESERRTSNATKANDLVRTPPAAIRWVAMLLEGPRVAANHRRSWIDRQLRCNRRGPCASDGHI